MAYTRYPGLFIRRGDDNRCCYNKKDYISNSIPYLTDRSLALKPQLRLLILTERTHITTKSMM